MDKLVYKNKMINFSVLILLASCGSVTTIKDNEVKVESKRKEEISKTISLPVQYEIRPGEVVKIRIPGQEESTAVLKCKNTTIKSHITDGVLEAYVPETYFSRLKPFDCVYGKKVVAKFSVAKKSFPSERLKVDKKRVFLSKKSLKRVRKEQKFLNKNYRSSPKRPLFQNSFMMPIDSFVTSIYGSKRVFNKKKQTQHLGTDFRAAVGTPIKASNAGRVVVARDLFYTGNTVTIDHGLGVFTIYGHLSKLNVAEGDIVPRGMIIGEAGATGRVTGPHLHWGVKINGQFIEGSSLVKTSQDN